MLGRPQVLDCVRFGSQKCECHKNCIRGRPTVLYGLRFGPQTGDCHRDSGTQEQDPYGMHAIIKRAVVEDIPTAWWGRCWNLLALIFFSLFSYSTNRPSFSTPLREGVLQAGRERPK